MRQQERISRANHRVLRGTEIAAIVEGASPESEYLLQGRLLQQAPEVDGRLLFSNGTGRPGDIVRARITKTYAFDLVGDIREVLVPAPSRHRVLVPSLPSLRPAAVGR